MKSTDVWIIVATVQFVILIGVICWYFVSSVVAIQRAHDPNFGFGASTTT
jgi:hypothetical protein